MPNDAETFSFHAELLDAVEQAVIATDVHGRITYWNRFAEALYGWSQREMLGRDVRFITSFESLEEASRLLATLAEGERWTGAFRMRRRDGSEFPVHALVAPIRRDGDVVGLVGVSVDASSASGAETRHRALLRAAPDPIFRISRTGHFLEYTGPAGVRLLISADVMLGSHLADVLPPEVAARCSEAVERAVVTQSVVTVEYTLEDAHGSRLFEARVAPAGEDEVIAIVRDITRLRHFQNELHARVAERTEEIASLSRRLVAIQEEEWQRIGRELHDEIGQTVTALSMIIATARNDAGAARTLLDDAVELVRRLRESVHTLSRDLVAPLHDIDVVAALRTHIDAFSRRTGLTIDVVADPVERLSDAASNAIFRIVQEALTNVVRHAQATRASLHVQVASGTLRIEVADDGIGFDDATRGAGMWGMHQRAAIIGGELRIESVPGSGTRVSLIVPLDGSGR